MAGRLPRLGSPAPLLQCASFPAHCRGSVGDDYWRYDSGDGRPAGGRLIVSPPLHVDGAGGEWCSEVRASPVHRALSWSHKTADGMTCGAENLCATNGTLSPIAAAGMVDASSAASFRQADLAACDRGEVSEGKEKLSSTGRSSVVLCAEEDEALVRVSSHRVDCSSGSPHEGNNGERTWTTFHPSSTAQRNNSQPVVTVSALLEMMSAMQHSIQLLGDEVRELRLAFETVKTKFENGGSEHPAPHDTTKPLGGAAAAVQEEYNRVHHTAFRPPSGSPRSSRDS
ncbi:hypothetical protein LSM04_009155, partial [Trypanosoma melophagium]